MCRDKSDAVRCNTCAVEMEIVEPNQYPYYWNIFKRQLIIKRRYRRTCGIVKGPRVPAWDRKINAKRFGTWLGRFHEIGANMV